MSETNWIDFAGGALRLETGRIARLQLNQPDRHNAMSFAMWRALPEALAAVEADAGIRVLVVEGAGGKAFCSGADISEFSEVYGTKESTENYNAIVRKAQARLRHLSRPTIALVEGICVGGGCGIALACDLRFSSDVARFGITPAKLGVAYSLGDTAQLVEKVGPARAKDILFSGRLLKAAEALTYGLVDWVFRPEEVRSACFKYASGIAELSQTSIVTSKRMINALTEGRVENAAELDRLFTSAFEGADFREGFSAFLEKRKPQFK